MLIGSNKKEGTTFHHGQARHNLEWMEIMCVKHIHLMDNMFSICGVVIPQWNIFIVLRKDETICVKSNQVGQNQELMVLLYTFTVGDIFISDKSLKCFLDPSLKIKH